MLKLGELAVLIKGKNDGLDESLDKAQHKARQTRDKMKASFSDIAAAALGAWATIGAVSKINDAIKAASDLQQSIGGVDAVFHESANTMHQWAQDAAKNLGLSENEANQFAAVLGAQLKNAGTPLDQVADKTKTLVALGADLAATYGGTTSDAVESLSAALKGEMDPIEKYGISLNQAQLQAQALSMGIKGDMSTWDTATKQQVTLAAVTKQSTDAQGQFAAQADSVAEKQQIANAQWENAKAKLGEALLPAVASVTDKLGEMADFLVRNKNVMVPLLGILGGLVGVIYAITLAQKAWVAIQWLLNIAMDANPIGILIIVIALLIAIVVLLVKHWDKVVSAFKTGTEAVKNFFVNTLWHDGIEKAWNWILDAGEKVVNWFKALPGKIADAAKGMWNGIVDAFKSAINWLIRLWNDFHLTIGGGSILGHDLPSITLNTPDIPYLAKGALIPATPGGKLFAAGEAGQDELVSPVPTLQALTRQAVADAMRDLGDLGVAAVQVDVYLDGRHLDAHTDARIVRAQQRTADWTRAARGGRRR